MHSNKAYIIGALNKAILSNSNNSFDIIEYNKSSNKLTSYEWSQICNINPEYIEVNYESVEDLYAKINIEKIRNEALDFCLELMDNNFSLDYKLGISDLLIDILDTSKDIIYFIENRLLSTPIPKNFNPRVAYNILYKKKSSYSFLYDDLESKTELFNKFYTLQLTELNIGKEKQEIIDYRLTDNGVYSKFCLALYNKSDKDYDTANVEAIKILKELHLLNNYELYSTIKKKLITFYNFEFEIEVSEKNIISNDIFDDEIIKLFDTYIQNEHIDKNNKIGKRGESYKVKKYNPNILEDISSEKEFIINKIYRSEIQFWYAFKELILKQLASSKPEHICMTICDIATHFIDSNWFEISDKLLEYAKYINPDDPVVDCQRANTLYKKNNINEAIELYDNVISNNPTYAVALRGKANIFKKIHKYSEALSLYDQSIEYSEDKDLAFSYCGKAEVYKEIGNYNESIKLFDLSIKRFNKNVTAYCGKAEVMKIACNFEEALLLYDNSIRIQPKHVTAYCGKAEIYKTKGELQKSLDLYNTIISNFPNSVVAYCGKAEVIKSLGQYDESLRQYELTIKEFSKEIVAYNGKAEVLKEIGRYEEAINFFDETIKEFPKSVVAYNGKAEVYKEMGQFVKALKEYEYNKNEFPCNSFARRGWLHLLLLNNKLEEFEDNIKKENYITIGDTYELHMYCMYFIKKGDFETALKKIDIGLSTTWVDRKNIFIRTKKYIQILDKKYRDVLQGINIEDASEKVLAIHAYAEVGNTAKASQFIREMEKINKPIIKNTLQKLSVCYQLNNTKNNTTNISQLQEQIKENEYQLLFENKLLLEEDL